MKIYHQSISKLKDQRGAVAVIVAISVLFFVLGIAALAIDIGYVAATKNELQNVADSSALAGAGLLGEIYTNMSYDNQQIYDVTSDGDYDDTIFSGALDIFLAPPYATDEESIERMAYEAAIQNKAAGKNIDIMIDVNDIQIGRWDASKPDPNKFEENPIHPNAVKVIARRDSTANTRITTFFARIFGVDDLPVSADAVAALTGQSYAGPGEVELPIGISTEWFDLHDDDGSYCGDQIAFSPPTDPDACGGWTGWLLGHNDNLIGNILNNSNGSDPDPSLDSPAITAEETIFDFTNGNLSQQTFYALQALFQIKGHDVTPSGEPACGFFPDPDGDTPKVPCYKPVHWDVNITGSIGNANNPLPQMDSKKTDEQTQYPNIFEDTLRYAHRWQTGVLVYEDTPGDCAPNETLTIVGFVEVELTHVGDSSDKIVYGNIKCDYVEGPTTGGGGSFGKYGSVPNLVE